MIFESNTRTTHSRGEFANILRFTLGKSHDEQFELCSSPNFLLMNVHGNCNELCKPNQLPLPYKAEDT
ncbi:hypothetical protein EUGRSUZ_G00800 [Eucalyptus grandis]|uniref:Uncharacterized protein n=2 Tax=Eucalyptus grandis TaxID=71139 RepID=A0ACC3K101_EUCGR|nr:hypothetical protein EUGRSUZ_G00800 [Eucalyptus grandis]